MPAQPQIPNLRDVEAQTMRAELFALALQLGDPNASSARLNATFIWLHERLLKHLHTLNDKLETALRDYDPVLANRLEDGTLRLTALLQKLTPRFAELQAGEGADLSRERYSLHLDWNLLLAEYLVHLDLQARVSHLLQAGTEYCLSSLALPDPLAHCRERVRQYQACR